MLVFLTSEEAKQRREDIAKEADFYGSMDGASKFVKGDAIAGILILLNQYYWWSNNWNCPT